MSATSPPGDRRPALEQWAASANAAFRGSGYRGGRARRSVIGLLAQQDCCLGATEIFDRLRSEGSSVGLASVYRALDQLSRLRLVQRLDFGDAARYEPLLADGDHHHHVICDDCGKVEPFSDNPLERALGQLADQLGYEVEGHDVVLRGSCSNCREAA